MTARRSLSHELSGLAVIAQRDVIKLLRDRPRLAVNLAFPDRRGPGERLLPRAVRDPGVAADPDGREGGGRDAGRALPGVAHHRGAFGLVTIAALPSQRSAMQIFQFLIIPQYVLGGVLVPLQGQRAYLEAIGWAMPLRYAVELSRAAFYAGTPGYARVVTAGPALDVLVIAALTVLCMSAGALVFDHRERTR
jgi:ABC-2 type transporter